MMSFIICQVLLIFSLYTILKNDVISLVRKRYWALGIGLGLRLKLGLGLDLGLGLAEIRFQSNVFSIKCGRYFSLSSSKVDIACFCWLHYVDIKVMFAVMGVGSGGQGKAACPLDFHTWCW